MKFNSKKPNASFFARDANYGDVDSGAAGSSRLRVEHKLDVARKTANLNLANLNLEEVPEEIFDLRESLLRNGGDGGLKAWEIFGEEAQTSVDLSHNPLRALPPRICKFLSCKKLRLRNCKIGLGCGANDQPPLTSIISTLADLKTLDLSENSISGEFPVAQLPRGLVDLNISRNEITCLRFGDEPFPSLTALDASSNRISEPPASLAPCCPSLLSLDLSSNDLRSLPSLPSSLAKVSLLGNGLTGVLDLAGLEGLDRANFGRNALSSCVNVARSMLTLDLSDNSIQGVRGLFSSGDDVGECDCKMTELRLRGNKIRQLEPTEFYGALHLTLLDLADNDLSDLPSILGYLPKLSKICLEGNCLRGNMRPSMVVDVPKLKKTLRFRSPPPLSHPKYLLQDGGEEEEEGKAARAQVFAARAAFGDGLLDLSDSGFRSLPDRVLEELEFELYDEEQDLHYTQGSRLKCLKARGK